jgi:osmotically inducible protein OsmC
MPVDVKYTTTATATGGRDGHAATKDGALDVKLSLPKELGGKGGPGNNPEQLFAAGYAACFHSALKLVAAKSGADTTDSEVVADVSLGALQAGGFRLAAQIEVSLPMLDRETAEALVAQAHQVCPYSNATRGNMEVTLAVA